MPELPEVEVVKKSLESQINNLTIKKVQINDENLRYKVKKKDLKKISGLKILSITRRSKYLILALNIKFSILIHLGMTGKFYIISKNKKKKKLSFYYDMNNFSQKHDRVIFIMNNKIKLIYNDVRKFGFIKVISTRDIDNNPHLKNLGPEPLGYYFNTKYFKNYIIGKKRTIKNLLMDHKFVSGLGNIYANEILFLSKIKPQKKVKKLTDDDIKKIVSHTKKVLKKAIIFGGSSIKDFSNSIGKRGNFQQYFNVYGKKDKNCGNIKCQGTIEKIVIDNRATFFCARCQK